MGRRSPSIPGAVAGFVPLLLACAVVLGFPVLRYGSGGDDGVALIASQIVFLLAPLSAALLTGMAARRAPARSRIALVWALLCVATASVSVSELLYARYAVMGISPAGVSAADVFNGLAMLAFVAHIAALARIDALGSRRLAQFLLDLVIVLVLSFVLVYRFGVSRWIDVVGAAQAVDAIRLGVYSAVGVAILMGTAFCWSGLRGRSRAWNDLTFGGLGVYGLGVVLWPVWQLSALDRPLSPQADAVVTMLYLVGYCLVALGALTRLRHAGEPWNTAVSAERPRLVWPGMASATLVFASVGVLAWAVLDARNGSVEEVVYFFGVSVASACMVGRTALMGIELDDAREESSRDALTGSFNSRQLAMRIEEEVAAAIRDDESLSVAIVDVDDLADVNRAEGTETGDRVLKDIARALEAAAGGRERVFRSDGDQFAVLLSHVGGETAATRARTLLTAVDDARPAGLDVTVSVGLSTCPDHTSDPQLLLAYAEIAQRWAKDYGKHRTVTFDRATAESAGNTMQLEILPTGPTLDIARALSAAADARDPSNHRHSRNVAALARLLSVAAGLDSEHVRRIEVAAMLHDVGKIALPDEMLGGRMASFRQRHREQEHAVLGSRLVEALGVEGVSCWVRAHHERWDGRGYPDGLAGAEIPLEARIIALADAYDGMTTGKRYGAPMSKAAALQEIDLGLGARFDPEIAELFINVVGTTGALGWSDEWPAA